jgi:hypothetical protein
MRRILLAAAVLVGVAGNPQAVEAQCGSRCVPIYAVEGGAISGWGCVQDLDSRMDCLASYTRCLEQSCGGGGSLALSDADGNLVAVAERCGERVLGTVAVERRTLTSEAIRLATFQIE